MTPLPTDPSPSGCEAALVGFAIRMRPSSGGAAQLIDRPGSRFRLKVSMPPMRPEQAGPFTAALIKAQRTGLEMDVPLLGRSQGNPGTPVVDGADQTGTTINLRGLLGGYTFKPGYWLTLVDADDNFYLHQASATTSAAADGTIALPIEPPIRAPLADGATVLVARPKVQGFLTEESAWNLNPGEIVTGLSFALEESA